jgi:parallel beta-helix repeat protein
MKKVQRCLGVLLVAGYMASGDVAQAASYFVSRTGSNGNPGTEAAPFLTINYGVSRLRAGDTLWIRAGVYDESLLYNVPSGTSWDNMVRIAGYPGETVTMRPTSGDFVLGFAGSSDYGNSGEQKYIEFDGVNLDASGGIRLDAVKIESGPGYDAHHIRIANATVTGNPSPTQNVQHPGNAQVILLTSLRPDSIGANEFKNLVVRGGPAWIGVGNDFSNMFYIKTPDNVIENCIIEDGIGAGIQLFNSSPTGAQPHRTIIRNNIIRNFTRASATRGDGILAAGGSGHKIYNNLVYNIAHVGFDSAGIQIWTTVDAEVYNNTVYGNAAFGIIVEPDTSGTVLRNNISYGNGADYVDRGSRTTTSHNLIGIDPRFVDPSAVNFELQAASPAVDAGMAVPVVTRDLAGTLRPEGGSYDIGAYERPRGGRVLPPSSLRLVQN